MTRFETDLIQALQVILASMQDPRVTISQLYYRLTSLPSDTSGHIPNTTRSYTRFVALMTKARMEKDSRIDWRRIVDTNESAFRILEATSEERKET